MHGIGLIHTFITYKKIMIVRLTTEQNTYQVNTDFFHEMCLIATSETQVCTSIAAYLMACKMIGVPLKTPSMCVK